MDFPRFRALSRGVNILRYDVRPVGWIEPAQPGEPIYSGGGRNTTSCLAERATTSSGFCSFMLWIAQNKS
jgi:hypothetical protein